MSKRMLPADRKASILEAALSAATKHGYTGFRLVDVAAHAGCSTGSVMAYYKTMAQVKRDVMRAAISRKVLPIIATGIAVKDPYCRKIAPELRARALATLSA